MAPELGCKLEFLAFEFEVELEFVVKFVVKFVLEFVIKFVFKPPVASLTGRWLRYTPDK